MRTEIYVREKEEKEWNINSYTNNCEFDGKKFHIRSNEIKKKWLSLQMCKLQFHGKMNLQQIQLLLCHEKCHTIYSFFNLKFDNFKSI